MFFKSVFGNYVVICFVFVLIDPPAINPLPVVVSHSALIVSHLNLS